MSTTTKSYPPQLRWTTFAGKRRLMWAGYDSEGHLVGWYLEEEIAKYATSQGPEEKDNRQ
jgi:hypothetical protein